MDVDSLPQSTLQIWCQLVDTNGREVGYSFGILLRELALPQVQWLLRALVEDPFSVSYFANVHLQDVRVYKSRQDFDARIEGAKLGEQGGPLTFGFNFVDNGALILGAREDEPLWVMISPAPIDKQSCKCIIMSTRVFCL